MASPGLPSNPPFQPLHRIESEKIVLLAPPELPLKDRPVYFGFSNQERRDVASHAPNFLEDVYDA